MNIFRRFKNSVAKFRPAILAREYSVETFACFDPFKGPLYSGPKIGKVIERVGDRLLVEPSPGGDVIECRQRKTLDAHNIVAGDVVHFQSIVSNDVDEYIAVGYNIRKNILFRSDPKQPRKVKYIASNIDQLLIVVAVEPLVSLMSIDQLLVAAEAHGMKSHIVVNKCDLKGSSEYINSLKFYEILGYPLIRCSVDLSIYESRDNEESHAYDNNGTASQVGTRAVKRVLAGKTSLLIGQSGKWSVFAK
jgi:putative ribosome biogenesis GTPase RsgA